MTSGSPATGFTSIPTTSFGLTPQPSLPPINPTNTVPDFTPIPLSSPSATPLTCWEEGGWIEQTQLETSLLRQPLEYSIYLPPCYEAQPERRYPSLYLIHGQSYTDDQWDRLGADETADTLIAAGELSPLIIIMPRDRTWEQPAVDKFGDAVVEALIPMIDKRYRTIPERSYRAVGGLSRGAGWAVHLGLTHWELFAAIGGHSLAVFTSDAPKIRRWLDAIPPESMPRIYLDIGDKDRPNILRSALWFEALLTEKRIPHAWFLFNGYHDEAYWSTHVEQYLRWYAENW